MSGRACHVLLREELFDPLGINDWGLGSPGIDNPDSQPWGHTKSNGLQSASFMPYFAIFTYFTRSWMPIKPGPFADNPLLMAPAGTLHMPLRDWARFVQAHILGGKSGLLRQATFDELHRPEMESYAAGWSVTTSIGTMNNTTVWVQSGSNTMNHAVVVVLPDRDQAIMDVTNGFDQPRGDAVQAGVKRVFDEIIEPQLGPSDT